MSRRPRRPGTRLSSSLTGFRGTALEVDASGIERGDVSGLSLLYELAEGRLAPGVRATVTGLRPELAHLLAAFPTEEAFALLEEAPPKRPLLAEIGAATQSMFADLRAQAIFIGAVVQGFAAALRRPRLMRWREVGVVFEKAGVNALPIVSLISLLMGLVIAFEAAQPLEMFGAQIFIANMIGLVMVREFSPIFTAIILAGRSGSAFAAEIGTMKVNEELDALETMGLDPGPLPRHPARLRGHPADAGPDGLLDARRRVRRRPRDADDGLPARPDLGPAPRRRSACTTCSWARASRSCSARSSPGSGACAGMQTKEGPNAVGDSTTRAVVAGILMIIVVDAVFAVVTYVLHI